jgi:hypothetical protein
MTLARSVVFRAVAGGPLFWPHEGHWTPRGHRIAGEEVAKFLAASRLLAAPRASRS